MAEENNQDISMSQDDMHVLRILLHSIKGLSPVSMTEAEAVVYSDQDDV